MFPEYATDTMAFVLFMEYTEISKNGSSYLVESLLVQVRVAAGNEMYTFDSPYKNEYNIIFKIPIDHYNYSVNTNIIEVCNNAAQL